MREFHGCPSAISFNILTQRGDLERAMLWDCRNRAVIKPGRNRPDFPRAQQVDYTRRLYISGQINIADRAAKNRIAHTSADETDGTTTRIDRIKEGARVGRAHPVGGRYFLNGCHF
jgi:hypothetical protein